MRPSLSSEQRVGAVSVISSIPSWPWTTSTRREPSFLRTSAKVSVRSGAKTPMSWQGAPAGLVRGPSRLKSVRTPSCLRTGPAKRIALWKAGAKRKVMPSSFNACSMISGSALRFRPSCSRQSALPLTPELARLPCLATVAPAPAATKATVVEMLKVMPPSPPVPTVSSVFGTSDWTRVAAARMARAPAEISSTVSPLAASAARNAPVWPSVSSPARTAVTASKASFSVRSRRAMSFLRRVGNGVFIRFFI
ncbi:MAG: hypothetical protein BWX70_03239 [Verrucomicrobia bacterium ADurb.Bin070]|nr:MAG: hypothetical protein BWX70_03239 [Verrucomicrobia bacterium ADurb.Bin070]